MNKDNKIKAKAPSVETEKPAEDKNHFDDYGLGDIAKGSK